jgi:hypothetical protein
LSRRAHLSWWDEALIFLAWALSDDGAFGRPFA